MFAAALGVMGALSIGCTGVVDGSGNAKRDPLSPSSSGKGGTSGQTLPGITLDDAPPFEPSVLPVRRLIRTEYSNAIRDLLGAKAEAALVAPEDALLNGFSTIAAGQFTVSSHAVEAYEKSARAAAAAAELPPLLGCQPATLDDRNCLTRLVETFGRRAWRRPLEPDETARWVNLGAEAARTLGKFDEGARAVIAGMLQSPYFLYFAPVGVSAPDRPNQRRLSGYELAARLSFTIAGTTPSDQLLLAAERGELDEAAGVRTAARALVEKGAAGLATFLREHIGFAEVQGLDKDTTLFPTWSATLATAMAEETRMFVEDLVQKRNGDARDLFTSTDSFVNAELAKLYKITVAGPGFTRTSLPSSQGRAGILGQGSFLARLSHRATTSPTFRGLFVRERLLCQDLAPPPANVDATIKPDAPGQPTSTRNRIERHRSDPQCNVCHELMDPIGIGFEQFDAIGANRNTENGIAIDANTDLDGEPFATVAELGQILRRREDTMPCLLINLYRFASGHNETEGEIRALLALEEAFKASNYHLADAMVELAASDAFRWFKITEENQ